MKLILIGYMGSGKSTVGKALSRATGFPFIDLDTQIERKEGQTISEIFKKKGEIYFRKREAAHLWEVLETKESMVLSMGGGTPCYGTVMEQLSQQQDVTTIYLKASVDTLTQRLLPELHRRPLIAHLEGEEALNDFIRKHLFERKFYYLQANLVIDVDGKDQKELMEELVMRLF